VLLFLQAADKEEEGRAFEMTCLLFKMTLLLFKLTCLLFNMTCPLPFVITSAVRNDVSAVRNDMAIVPSDQEFDCLLQHVYVVQNDTCCHSKSETLYLNISGTY